MANNFCCLNGSHGQAQMKVRETVVVYWNPACGQGEHQRQRSIELGEMSLYVTLRRAKGFRYRQYWYGWIGGRDVIPTVETALDKRAACPTDLPIYIGQEQVLVFDRVPIFPEDGNKPTLSFEYIDYDASPPEVLGSASLALDLQPELTTVPVPLIRRGWWGGKEKAGTLLVDFQHVPDKYFPAPPAEPAVRILPMQERPPLEREPATRSLPGWVMVVMFVCSLLVNFAHQAQLVAGSDTTLDFTTVWGLHAMASGDTATVSQGASFAPSPSSSAAGFTPPKVWLAAAISPPKEWAAAALASLTESKGWHEGWWNAACAANFAVTKAAALATWVLESLDPLLDLRTAGAAAVGNPRADAVPPPPERAAFDRALRAAQSLVSSGSIVYPWDWLLHLKRDDSQPEWAPADASAPGNGHLDVAPPPPRMTAFDRAMRRAKSATRSNRRWLHA